MEVATAAGFKPETSAIVAVKGKDAIVDAMEDILFGSVCIFPFVFMNMYLRLLDCRHSWKIH